MGMSAESRYEHNLKVLRRRDPSIISIFDQFSHVCVYHHNGEKWEKHGFEGSMFLYERDSYPPYGFYILNRMGVADYVQRLHPEDDIGAHGSYLMLRSYPDFTRERMAHLPQGHPKFSDVYKFDKDKFTPQQKGVNEVIGLWMFNTDAREPMIDVMIRLHSYIKRNIAYPDEYKYGPDRPPPPNPHLRTTNNVPGRTASAGSTSTTTASTTSSPSLNPPSGDLAILLAKLSSPSESSSTSAIVPLPETRPKPVTKMSVNDLFAAVQGHTPVQTPGESSTIGPPSTTSGTGIALLDSIFASAASSSSSIPSSSSALSTSSSRTIQPQTTTTTTTTTTTVTSETTTTSPSVSHARRPSTASVSTTSSRSAGAVPHRQPKQNAQIYSPQPSSNKPNGILTLTQAVVDGLLDGSGVGKGAFTGVGGGEGIVINGDNSHTSDRESAAHLQLSFDNDQSNEEPDVHDEDEEEILELDFADTRALSDLAVFDSRERKREKRRTKGKSTPITTQSQDKAGGTTDSVLDALFLRSRPTTENAEVVKVNGNTDHAPSVVKESSVTESILDALFANAAQNEQLGGQSDLGAIQGKDDLVREVERLLKHDQRFSDVLWEAYEARERGSTFINSNQRKRNRRR
ncbi:hypothetical protein E1B28_003088 [Marasmius oreades]|uniref:Uncharacterized protein n=1 Tax=Marasmius oreades TaxID=181124 RepID=A0A9P7RKN3_9AGAR|nr:uncharacterized protein E1B28_003088 [Marasmius oreades]KAG7085529.1 hypothetical protein E1B28_003088 [Marasmius oreades]